MTTGPQPRGRARLVKAFWVAVALSLVLHLLQPYGRYVLYPFALLSTWAHEMGHGLTALLMGGSFGKLVVFSNLGGYATHSGVSRLLRPLVSAGGLLGPALLGGAIIVLGARSERAARAVLYALSIALLVSLVVWIRSLFGLAALSVIALAATSLALKGNAFVQLVVTQLLGIQFCLGSLSSVDYMFTKEFVRDGQTQASDTQHIAEVLLLPYWFWGGLITALSIAILLGAFYVGWVRPLRGVAPNTQEDGPTDEPTSEPTGEPTDSKSAPTDSKSAPTASKGALSILDELQT